MVCATPAIFHSVWNRNQVARNGASTIQTNRSSVNTVQGCVHQFSGLVRNLKDTLLDLTPESAKLHGTERVLYFVPIC